MEVNSNQDLIKVPEPAPKKKHPFAKGILVGALGMLALFIMGSAALVFVLITSSGTGSGVKRLMDGSNEFSAEVEKKTANLLALIELYGYYDTEDIDFETGVYKGVVEALDDDYAAYYTAEEYAKLLEDFDGAFYGIGATLQKNADNGTVAVVKVYKDSPAMKAGIKEGDIIVSADDHDAADYNLDDFVSFIRGEKGTVVHLDIYREGETDYLGFDIERDEVQIVSVEGEMLEDGIALITIDTFSENTASQLRQTCSELEAQGMKAIIFDLRTNGGGLLDSVVEILDDILPSGTVVYTETKDGKREDFTSAPSCMNYPMVVLTSGYTASAAEIFAGAIKDYDYGTILGTRTFGKGIVQTTIPLSDGSALKVTTSKYFLPSGHCIHGEGIEPDEELEYKFLGEKDESYDISKDNQIQRAIEILAPQL